MPLQHYIATAQCCTYQSFPRRIANCLSQLILSCWLELHFPFYDHFSVLLLIDCVPPLQHLFFIFEQVHFGRSQGIKLSVQEEIDFMCLCRFWTFSRVDDLLQHKWQVCVTTEFCPVQCKAKIDLLAPPPTHHCLLNICALDLSHLCLYCSCTAMFSSKWWNKWQMH